MINFLSTLQFYQVAILVISLLMIYFGLEKFIRHDPSQSILKLAVRLVVWGGMAAIALDPEITEQIANFIGIKGNINAVVLLGFLLVFLMIFKILSVVEKIEHNLTTLTRRDALDKLKRKNDTDRTDFNQER